MVCKTMYSSSILLGTSPETLASQSDFRIGNEARVFYFWDFGYRIKEKMSVGTSRADPHTNHIINNTKTNNQ